MQKALLLLVLFSGMAAAPNVPDLKKICADEDAEVEYERLKFHELTQCLAKELNASAFRQEILDAGNSQKVDAVIAKVCTHLPQIMACTGAYVSSIGPCMDAHQRHEKELWRNLRMMNMEFACGEGRRDLVQFIDDGGISCIALHRGKISACVDERFPALLRQQSDTQIVKVLATITQEDDRCSNLNDVERCIDGVLTTCMKTESIKIIRQYFSSLYVLFECAAVNDSAAASVASSEIKEGDLQPSEYGAPSMDTIAQMQQDSVVALGQLKQWAEDLLAAEQSRADADAQTARHLAAALREHTLALQQMADALQRVAATATAPQHHRRAATR